MAELFLAEIESLHGFRKKVVIKQMLPQYADDPQYVEMFLDEARLVARLNHASIVQVFDIGRGDNGVFFAMEYVDGFEVSHILRKCYRNKMPMDLAEVLAIAIPIAEALDHAHNLKDENGDPLELIHRDVSPSNIIVTTEGRVKLLDFGVAKSNAQLNLTVGNSVKGKLGYMAPEQIRGEDLDKRCDVFSFGIVLWELLVGKRLFPGTERSALKQVLEDSVEVPSTYRPSLPPEIDEICMKALTSDRDKRYGSLRMFLDDVDAFALKHKIVRTSGTLKNMIEKFYPDGRRTNTMSEAEAARLSVSTGISSTVSSSVSSGLIGSDASTPQEAEPKKKGVPWLVGIGILTFAGVALVLFSGGDDAETEDTATSGLVVTPSSITENSPSTESREEKFSVQLKIVPESAQIEVDGKFVGQGKFSQKYTADKREHHIRVFAPGYEEVKVTFRDSELIQTITLNPVDSDGRSGETRPIVTTNGDSTPEDDKRPRSRRRRKILPQTATEVEVPVTRPPKVSPRTSKPPKRKQPKLGGGSDNLDPWD